MVSRLAMLLTSPDHHANRAVMANREIDARVEAFTAELSALIRRAAFEAVREALEGRAALTLAPRAGRPVAPAAKTVRATKLPAVKLGGKRDPASLEALVERLHAYIKANAAQRIEQIGVGLGTPTKQLALPIKKLLAAKRITRTGQKRSTAYSAPTSANGGLVLLPKRKRGVSPTAKDQAATG